MYDPVHLSILSRYKSLSYTSHKFLLAWAYPCAFSSVTPYFPYVFPRVFPLGVNHLLSLGLRFPFLPTYRMCSLAQDLYYPTCSAIRSPYPSRFPPSFPELRARCEEAHGFSHLSRSVLSYFCSHDFCVRSPALHPEFPFAVITNLYAKP